MKIFCPNCAAEYDVSEAVIGGNVECSRCNHKWTVTIFAPRHAAPEPLPVVQNQEKDYLAHQPEKPKNTKKSEYLPGFHPPFVAIAFGVLKFVCLAGFVFSCVLVLAFQEKSAILLIVPSLCGAFSMYILELTFTLLAEIAYNTRQIAKNQERDR